MIKFAGYQCLPQYGRYPNGRLSIRLIDLYERYPVATATLNVDAPLPNRCAYIKDYSENAGMVDVLEPKYEQCTTCAGKGYTQTMVTTSQGSVPFFDRCQTCFMATKFRVVRFK